MKKSVLIVAASLLVSLTANQVFAQTQPRDTTKQDTSKKTTAGAAIPTGDVVSALSSNSDYSMAALALKTTSLASVLKSGGPYTIFAPNNVAFSNLPAGQLDTLMKNQNKMETFLKGHIVTGRYTKADIIKVLTDGKGKATLTTLDNQPLTLSVSPKKTLQLTSAAGMSAEVTLYDLLGTNGIVNGINGMLMPAK
jgi:uncharacterized surface protein with fasciclin (FAS1) repeats